LNYWRAPALAAEEKTSKKHADAAASARPPSRKKPHTQEPPRPPARPKFRAKTWSEKTPESHHRNPQDPQLSICGHRRSAGAAPPALAAD
jgi:hypothetical protein